MSGINNRCLKEILILTCIDRTERAKNTFCSIAHKNCSRHHAGCFFNPLLGVSLAFNYAREGRIAQESHLSAVAGLYERPELRRGLLSAPGSLMVFRHCVDKIFVPREEGFAGDGTHLKQSYDFGHRKRLESIYLCPVKRVLPKTVPI